MKELYCEIAFLLLIAITNCLAIPTVWRSSKILDEISQEPAATAAAENVIETQPLLHIEINKELLNTTKTNPDIKVQSVEEQSLYTPADIKEATEDLDKHLQNMNENYTNIDILDDGKKTNETMEIKRNVEIFDDEKKSVETLTDLLAVKNMKEEELKLKDSPKDVEQKEIDKQSEVWKEDYENYFSLLKDRLPDLTAEEYHEISKDGAMPWNFLKRFDIRREINAVKPKPMQTVIPIHITIPIVINTHSGLPLSLSIGGQDVPLNTGMPVKEQPKQITAAVKQPAVSALATPTSTIQHRPTNRHRSKLLNKIYARHSGLVM